MPTIAYTHLLRSRDENVALALNATHRLVFGDPCDPPLKKTTRVPPSLDVVHQADVVISVCATMNGRPVLGKNLKESALALYLVDFLNLHAEHIGISNVSELYLDEVDGRTKFTVSSCSQLDPQDCVPHLTLISIDLVFSCRSLHRNDNEDSVPAIDLFSSQAYLPFMTILGNVFYRFVVHQLLVRYPIIFGSCCRKINAELLLLPSICRSFLGVADRSSDSETHRRVKRLLKRLNRHLASSVSNKYETLARYLGSSPEDLAYCDDSEPTLTREQLLFRCLLRLLKSRIKPIRLKSLSKLSSGDFSDLDLAPDSREDPLVPAELRGKNHSPLLDEDFEALHDEPNEEFEDSQDINTAFEDFALLSEDGSDDMLLDNDSSFDGFPLDDPLDDSNLAPLALALDQSDDAQVAQDVRLWVPASPLSVCAMSEADSPYKSKAPNVDEISDLKFAVSGGDAGMCYQDMMSALDDECELYVFE